MNTNHMWCSYMNIPYMIVPYMITIERLSSGMCPNSFKNHHFKNKIHVIVLKHFLCWPRKTLDMSKLYRRGVILEKHILQIAQTQSLAKLTPRQLRRLLEKKLQLRHGKLDKLKVMTALAKLTFDELIY